MSKTAIEWATHTENYQAGCTKRGPECAGCYAESMSARLASMGPARYRDVTDDRGRWTGRLAFDGQALDRIVDGLQQAVKPRRVFLGSMTDLFHEDANDRWLVALAELVREVPRRHTLMVLTKRARRLLEWQRRHFAAGLPPNLWPGVTAGTQASADERLEVLALVRARGIRFVSVEPMLERVDLDLGFWADRRVGWVIAGGESGPRARPLHPAWVRSLRDQCVAAGVPFMFKQWGEWAPATWADVEAGTPGKVLAPTGREKGLHEAMDPAAGDSLVARVGKKAAGRELDGETWDQTPADYEPPTR